MASRSRRIAASCDARRAGIAAPVPVRLSPTGTSLRINDVRRLAREYVVLRFRCRRRRSRPRRVRSGAGGGPHGSQDRALDDESRHHRPDELQPGHRRSGQGADRPRDRRPGRRDGPRHRRDGHPVPHAQPDQGAGHAQPPRPGGQKGVSVLDEAPHRRAAEPQRPAGNHRTISRSDRRPPQRRARPRRRRLSGRRGRLDDGHVSPGDHAHGRSQDGRRPGGRRHHERAFAVPFGAGL